MSSQGPNPLRPYYIPPPPTIPLNASSHDVPISVAPTISPRIPAPGSSSLSDLSDYSDYVDMASIKEMAREFTNAAVLGYAAVLTSQPFEVAMTILQCQVVPRKDGVAAGKSKERWDEEEEEEEEFDDAASDGSNNSDLPYFTTNLDDSESPQLRLSKSRQQKKVTDRAGYVLDSADDPETRQPWQIKTSNAGAVSEVLKALWSKEGPFGVWKGTNATFVYTILSETLGAWSSSFLSAVFSLSDPNLVEIADSAHPFASLGVAVASAAITAIILSPLDIIRTRLILTPRSDKPRNLLPSLRTLPSYTIPPHLLIPTTLHAALPALIEFSTPYFLRSRLGLDPVLTPTTFKIFSFLSSALELCIELPLETVLRRGQIQYAKPAKTVVPVGRYAGVAGTIWLVCKEEEGGRWGGEGLYRGWRIGLWGNVGVLGLGLWGFQQAGAAGGAEF